MDSSVDLIANDFSIFLILGKAQRIAEYLAIAFLEIFLVACVDFAIDQFWLKRGAIVPANARSAGKSGANIPA